MPQGPLVLFGAGRMGSALAEGWLKGPLDRPLFIIDPHPAAGLKAHADAGRLTLNPPAESAGVLAVCVKPQVFPSVAQDLTHWIGPETAVLSIMAGIRLDQLASRLGTARIIRAMPNTPGAIGQGVTLISPGPGATTADTTLATALLAPLGLVEGPMDEDQLSIATAVSGCGPAYLFLLAEILGDAGTEAGLDPALSARIAQATVTGAAALLASGDTSPADLRRAVTSPNGVTQAALEVLMAENGWPSPMHEAIAAAVARDAALSAALDAEQGDGQD